MKIVIYTAKDIPGFVEFRHKSKKESPFLNDTTLELATAQQEEYSSENKRAYLLKDNNKVIGQLFLRYDPNTKIVGLGLISILNEYQGKGYARKLLAKVDDYAKEKNAKQIDLYVDNKNTHAIKVYEKLGYRKLKDHGKTRMLYSKSLVNKIAKENISNNVYLNW